MESFGKLASSLPVPYVQHLSASLNGTSEIPEKYVRPDIMNEPVMVDTDDIELPVIDLGLAMLSKEEALKLGQACGEWGFFQLINHGVSVELVEKLKQDITKFFNLSTEEKETIAQLPNSFEGYGQVLVKSEDQKLDWGDAIVLSTFPPGKRDMKFWPTNPSSFRDTLDAYTAATREVTNHLLKLMAENLGIDPEAILDSFIEMGQTVRISYYPPCPQAEKAVGLSPHSDCLALTILAQLDEVNGLQIRKDGKWFLVKPLSDAFIVNIGDLLEILTNGKYKSIEHRVAVNREKTRISVAAFHGPNENSTVAPLPQLVKGGVKNYRSTTFGNYVKEYFSAKLDGKNVIENMKVQN